MTPEPWMVAAVALFVLGHAVILLFVYRLRRGGTSALSATAATSGNDGASAVCCRECGIENDDNYRFCRQCAAELPGGVVPGGSSESPDSRGML